MDKLVTYDVDGQAIAELDLGEEVSVPLVHKVNEVRSPEKKTGSYSMSMKLPGTNKNNKFFGAIYDVNSDYTVFNPHVKTYVVLTVSSEEVIDGYLRLRKIIKDDKDNITYDVFILDSSVNFWSDMGDKLIVGNSDSTDDIDFTDMEHEWNLTNVENSWNSTWDSSLGCYYPLLNQGTGNVVNITDLRPAIFHKRLLDKIISHHGYTWSGSLKTDPLDRDWETT